MCIGTKNELIKFSRFCFNTQSFGLYQLCYMHIIYKSNNKSKYRTYISSLQNVSFVMTTYALKFRYHFHYFSKFWKIFYIYQCPLSHTAHLLL